MRKCSRMANCRSFNFWATIIFVDTQYNYSMGVIMEIQNLPEYAKNHKYIVARMLDNDYWFYGAYDDIEQAQRIAQEIGGIIKEQK